MAQNWKMIVPNVQQRMQRRARVGPLQELLACQFHSGIRDRCPAERQERWSRAVKPSRPRPAIRRAGETRPLQQMDEASRSWRSDRRGLRATMEGKNPAIQRVKAFFADPRRLRRKPHSFRTTPGGSTVFSTRECMPVVASTTGLPKNRQAQFLLSLLLIVRILLVYRQLLADTVNGCCGYVVGPIR